MALELLEPATGRRWRRFVIVVVLVAGGVVAVRQATRPNQLAVRYVDEGPAPTIDAPRLDDPTARVNLAAFRGRPLVLNFWASWCVPCRKEMPALSQTATRLQPRVAFLGINHQDGLVPARDFEEEVGVLYPSGFDPTGDIARRYAVQGLPTTIFIDARGRIVGRRLGAMSTTQLLEALRRSFGDDVVAGS